MSEPVPIQIRRTISGDSYGNIINEGDSSGMICDENKTNEEDDKISYVVRTDGGKGHTLRSSSQKNMNDENLSNEDILPSEQEAHCEETVSKTEIDSLAKEQTSNSSKDYMIGGGVIDSSENENDINRVLENVGNEINTEKKLPDDNLIIEDHDKNKSGTMDYSKDEMEENNNANLSVFVNVENKELNGVSQPVRKTHSIHLIPEAFEEDPCDDDDDDDDLDRNSQLSPFQDDDDVDNDGSDIHPVLLNANCISARSDNRPPTTSTMCELPGGLRAKANTPASFYNNNEVDPSDYQNEKVSGRLSSRESRDEVFHRAMTLMSNRCTSARGGDNALFSDREPPFGVHIPHYFFVYQKKPQPLAPLKAWRGYKGNVYFEPMRIQRVKNGGNTPEYLNNNNNNNNNNPTDDIHNNNNHNNISDSHNNINNNNMDVNNFSSKQFPLNRSMLRSAPLPQTRASHSYSTFTHNANPNPNPRGLVSSSASARPSYRLINSPANPIYVMDKSSMVNHHDNANMTADLQFIEGLESTGSLSVSQPGLFSRSQQHELFGPNNIINNNNNNISDNNNNNNNNTTNPFISHNSILQPNKDSKRLLYKRDRICRGSNFHKSKGKSDASGGGGSAMMTMNRNNNSNKVFSIKISDPKKKLITPDNSRQTSGAGSRMSVRRNNNSNAPGSANSNTNSIPDAKRQSKGNNPVRGGGVMMGLVVSGDKFAHHPPPKTMMQGDSNNSCGSGGPTYHSFPSSSNRQPSPSFPVTTQEAQDRITLDDDVDTSDNLLPPRVVSQVHVTLSNMADGGVSLPGIATPEFSDNEFNDEEGEEEEEDGGGDRDGRVDFVDISLKGPRTAAPMVPVDSG